MPSFSIGREPKLKIDNLREAMGKPGPLSYSVKLTTFDTNSFVMSKSKRKGL